MNRTKLKMNWEKGETGFFTFIKQRDAIAQERGKGETELQFKKALGMWDRRDRKETLGMTGFMT